METKVCTGDCLQCTLQQQIYCSSQRAYVMVKNQEAIFEKIETLEKILSKENIIPLAQDGRGVENSSPETN